MPGRPIRRRGARFTFATRLLLGGFGLSLIIVVAVSAFLLVSRDRQTRAGAQTNADSRAQALRQLVQQVTAPEARFAATSVAGLQSMARALADPADPRGAVGRLLSGDTKAVTELPNENIAVFDARGSLLGSTSAGGNQPLSAGLHSVRGALAGSATEDIEFLSASTPAYDVAAPVRAAGSTTIIGAVVYSAPLARQMLRLLPAVGQGYTAVLVPNTEGASLLRLSGDAEHPVVAGEPLPRGLGPPLGGSAENFNGFYNVAGRGEVAAAFTGIKTSANQRAPTVYLGVETPISAFVGDQQTDELTVVWIALSTILFTWLAVLLFVNRFVRRPVALLSEGVSRIAGGDYSSDIPVGSRDELGTLAMEVNRMRAQIEGNIRHIDTSVTRLGEVSRALTTTTAGVASLESAVCAAAAAMAGPGATAHLLARDGDRLTRRDSSRTGTPAPPLPREALAAVLEGAPARFQLSAQPALAVPMFYQQAVQGALMVLGPEPVTDADARALAALANNAAIALENTRLFEQERETVRRLRELDALKSDFLATAQHELRTPLTAIMGQLELMRMTWPQTDEAQKLGIIDDIEVSTHHLAEMLETIIDLSLISAANLRVRRLQVDLADEVRESIDEVMRRFRGGLPVNLQVEVPDGVSVDADPERLRQVIRCLVDNAVKFTDPGGTVRVTASLVDSGARCAIEVSDTGIGIDPALHGRIFERFFQVDNTGTRAYGGLGMGLALVKVLAEAHGATVELASARGHGSRFRIVWPCHPETGGAVSAGIRIGEGLTAVRPG